MGEELLGMMEGKKVKDGLDKESPKEDKGEVESTESKKPDSKSDMKKRVLMMAFIKKAKKKD